MNTRELDALVAEEVMGLSTEYTRYYNPTMPSAGLPVPPLHYSTDISAAWEVIKKFIADYDAFVRVERNENTRCNEEWYCSIILNKDWERFADTHGGAGWSGLTAPFAICLAALKAVGVTVEAHTPLEPPTLL